MKKPFEVFTMHFIRRKKHERLYCNGCGGNRFGRKYHLKPSAGERAGRRQRRGAFHLRRAGHTGVRIRQVHFHAQPVRSPGYVRPAERTGYFVEKIDGLVRLGRSGPANPEGALSEKYRYDFSYNGVDD